MFVATKKDPSFWQGNKNDHFLGADPNSVSRLHGNRQIMFFSSGRSKLIRFTPLWQQQRSFSPNSFSFLAWSCDVALAPSLATVQNGSGRVASALGRFWALNIGKSRVVSCERRNNNCPWDITYGSILGCMNIHWPPMLMFTRGTGF